MPAINSAPVWPLGKFLCLLRGIRLEAQRKQNRTVAATMLAVIIQNIAYNCVMPGELENSRESIPLIS